MSARARRAEERRLRHIELQRLVDAAPTPRLRDFLIEVMDTEYRNRIVAQNHAAGAWVSTIVRPLWDRRDSRYSYESMVQSRSGREFWQSQSLSAARQMHRALVRALLRRRVDSRTYKYRRRR